MSRAGEIAARRLDSGRFAPKHCGDPNCSGDMVPDTELAWLGGPSRPVLRCDGLTFIDDNGPLIACKVSLPALAVRRELERTSKP